MKNVLKMRVGSLMVASTMLISALPAFAEQMPDVTVVLEDITKTPEAAPILAGETKIKVSAMGVGKPINLSQLIFDIDKDIDYKSIQYLVDDSEMPESFQTMKMNDDTIFTSMVRMGEPIAELSESEPTDLFILTFDGEPGEKIKFSLVEDIEKSYFGEDFPNIQDTMKAVAQNNGIEAVAAEEGSEPVDAKISLEMSSVHDFKYFAPGSGKDSGVTISIIGEDSEHPIMYTIPVKESSGAIIPTMEIEAVLLKGMTYTVEVSGVGYITCKMTGVDFSDFEDGLQLTNVDFIPGELVIDGVIDAKDEDLFYEIMDKIASGEMAYNMAADFNRDGVVNEKDAKVFENVNEEPKEEKKAPEKMATPTVDGGNKKITVKWVKPEDNGSEITGYVIKYGTNESNLNKTEKITDKKATSKSISDLNAKTTYYVQIAAVNEVGTGEFSDIAEATTDKASGGGGGGGGGGGASAPSIPTTPSTGSDNNKDTNSEAEEEFADLGNYSWAKDSIYTLKNKGIINGTSSTTFSPMNNIKRGDFILILTKMLGINDEFSENFDDVSKDMYYYSAIGSAKVAGIAKGSENKFNPENTITRQDLITLAYRAFLNKGYIAETSDYTSLDAFGDKGDIADYAVAPMASMVSAGIIKGSNGNVNPQGNATRAEVAVMCARLLELMK